MLYRDSLVMKRVEKRLGRKLNAVELDHVDHDESFDAYDKYGELRMFTVPVYHLAELLHSDVSGLVEERWEVEPWA